MSRKNQEKYRVSAELIARQIKKGRSMDQPFNSLDYG